MLSQTTRAAALRHAVRSSLGPTLASQTTVCRAASTSHAISNPTLANIEKRWEGMPMQEQAELWMALRDRMKEDWTAMTFQEKRAAYWISFGNHGPRALPPPGEGKKVALYTFYSVVAATAIFGVMRYFARPPPHTMNKEWQEATNEYMLKQRADPFNGISSEGYEGKGFVQSEPKKA